MSPSSSVVAEAWADAFCLTCENFTSSNTFCSEQCKIADAELAQIRLVSASLPITSKLVHPFSNSAHIPRVPPGVSSAQPVTPEHSKFGCVDQRANQPIRSDSTSPGHSSWSPSLENHSFWPDMPADLAHVEIPLSLESDTPATTRRIRPVRRVAPVRALTRPGWERQGFQKAFLAYSTDELLDGLTRVCEY